MYNAREDREAMAAATEPTAVAPSKAGEDTEVVAVPAEVNLPVVIQIRNTDTHRIRIIVFLIRKNKSAHHMIITSFISTGFAFFSWSDHVPHFHRTGQ